MKEIAPDVIIESLYKGVTVGAVCTPEGVVMIDTPLSDKEILSWQSTCSRTGSGPDRLLVVLDDHPDRAVGVKTIRCPIITNSKTAEIFTARPSTTKMQGLETGAIWESIPEITTIDWPKPEITFSESATINWGEKPIVLEHHPGPTSGSIWVILPANNVIFIGDAVTPNHPPFLASANIKTWLISLDILKSSKYKDYLIISGRSALVNKDDIRHAQRFLKKALRAFEKLSSQEANLTKVQKTALAYIDEFKFNTKSEKELFRARLSYGFSKYYINHYSKKK